MAVMLLLVLLINISASLYIILSTLPYHQHIYSPLTLKNEYS